MRFFTVLLLVLSTSFTHADELNELVQQFQSELSDFLTETQTGATFVKMAELFRSDKAIKDMAVEMYKSMRDILTPEQQTDCMNAIMDTVNEVGGTEAMKKLVGDALTAFEGMMGEAIAKDREEFAAAEKDGANSDEVLEKVYARLRQYWNVEFGQKVIDVVKCSMPKEQWEVARKNGEKYMKAENFDMEYNC